MADYEPRYIFDAIELGLPNWWDFSALCAIKIAELWGCKKIKFLCLDACTNGSNRCFLDGQDSDINPRYTAQSIIMKGYMTPNMEFIEPMPIGARVYNYKMEERL
jgi:hypothetical protein